jgi:CO dehydrogenase/acetyl-CoA synthase gamma subunit (corrinoid Fe-S protein)
MVDISRMLPGYNCGRCGYRQCRDYANIAEKSGDVSKCPYLEHEKFTNARAEIEEYLSTHTRLLRKHLLIKYLLWKYLLLSHPLKKVLSEME